MNIFIQYKEMNAKNEHQIEKFVYLSAHKFFTLAISEICSEGKALAHTVHSILMYKNSNEELCDIA